MKRSLLLIVGPISMLFGMMIVFGVIAGMSISGLPKQLNRELFTVILEIAFGFYFMNAGFRWIREGIKP